VRRIQLSHAIALFEIHMKYGDIMPLADVMAALGPIARGRPSDGLRGVGDEGELDVDVFFALYALEAGSEVVHVEL